MFGISDRCKVDQFIAKKNFLSYGNLTKVEKDDLSKSIDKITLLYQITPANSNIKPYQDEIREYPLINIFKIDVEENANTKRISDFIMSAIPYPSLIVFRMGENMQLAAAHQRTNQNDISKNVLEDLIISSIQPYSDTALDIDSMKTTNIYALYSDIVDAISILNAKQNLNLESENEITGEEARELISEYEEIENKIADLKLQLKKETQFNKKVEINIEIKKLKSKINNIQNYQINGGTK